MEGVKIAIPSVPKLMGSEGFGGAGGTGVSVRESVTCDTDPVSVVVGSSIDGCLSFRGRKDVSGSPIPSESYLLEKAKHAEEISVFQHEGATEEMKIRGKNGSPLVIEPSNEGKIRQKRSYKVSKTSSGSVKRPRIAKVEVPANEGGSCGANEKSQLTKQKNVSKRLDKRNGKIAARSKSDSFSFKAGSFNSSGGGNSFLGLYGLKSDLRDVTEGMEELSVKALLDGSYMCPSFSQQKKVEDIKADSKESILTSVRKAASVLRLPRPIKGQTSVEVKVSSNQNVLTYSFVSSSSPSGRHENDEDNACASDLSSLNKAQDQNTNGVTTPHLLDSPLHQPKHVLERLSLPPAQDLETLLLLDVTKQSGPSKSNSDLRGKLSQRTGLPPFPWSNVNGSHCKSTDANKLSSSKTTCQGKWVKMGNTSNLEITSGFLKDFASIAFDRSLIPLVVRQIKPSENGSRASASVSVPVHDNRATMSSVPSNVPPESGCSRKSEIEDCPSPRLLAAARTLCDIMVVTQSSKANPNSILKQSKPFKSKMSVKTSGRVTISNATPDNNNRGKQIDEGLPFKKPKLNKNDKDKDRDPHVNNNGPSSRSISWSIPPRSTRTAPFNSLRQHSSFAETKCSNGSTPKQQPSYSRLPPQPSSSSRMSSDKARKAVSVDLNGAGSKFS